MIGAMDGATPLTAGLPVADLVDALEQGRIRTRYQPIVRMADRHPTGLEVLARLEHPRRGLVEADAFVPAMEAAGLGRRLSEAVAASALRDWQAFNFAPLGMTIAINLPLNVMMMADMPDWLEAARHGSTLSAGQVVIELTESQQLECVPILAAAIARYTGLGYRLAIDDVGPGIRDHRPLLALPFSLLKLDRLMVKAASDDAANADFLAFALQAARDADLTVIAEGVEDAATWARMAAAGIDQAQGYYIGQPLRAEDVATWHAGWTSKTPF